MGACALGRCWQVPARLWPPLEPLPSCLVERRLRMIGLKPPISPLELHDRTFESGIIDRRVLGGKGRLKGQNWS